MYLRSISAIFLIGFTLQSAEPAKRPLVAPSPPMGWNSYDAYDSNINEAEFKANVDVMARDLKAYGWQYAVIDFLWYNSVLGTPADPQRKANPDLKLDAAGKPLQQLTMDGYGRLTPSENRFPSAAHGAGFKPIADYVHAKGLKFGIHIMRGIPRQAYFAKLPVLDTKVTAHDIADTDSACSWLNYMYGVDSTKPGAQAYYDSLFRLYASWGVDFVKVDDLSATVYHADELELIHNAILKCGRPIVLSLSPGETPMGRARHVAANAQMWRISGDFWDNWPALLHTFDLLNAWSPFIGNGIWPDGDMLPIGHVGMRRHVVGPDRQSRFSWPEHYTLMTLWSIARSPLMIGADLVSSSAQSMAFLKNKEVLDVNQHSAHNRQVSRTKNDAVWLAEVPGSKTQYLALFNLTDVRRKVSLHLNDEALRGRFAVRDLWAHKDLGVMQIDIAAELEAHGAALYRLTPVR